MFIMLIGAQRASRGPRSSEGRDIGWSSCTARATNLAPRHKTIRTRARLVRFEFVVAWAAFDITHAHHTRTARISLNILKNLFMGTHGRPACIFTYII